MQSGIGSTFAAGNNGVLELLGILVLHLLSKSIGYIVRVTLVLSLLFTVLKLVDAFVAINAICVFCLNSAFFTKM